MTEPVSSNIPVSSESLAELKRDRDFALQLYYQSEREKEEFKDMDFESLLANIDQLVPFKEETL